MHPTPVHCTTYIPPTHTPSPPSPAAPGAARCMQGGKPRHPAPGPAAECPGSAEGGRPDTHRSRPVSGGGWHVRDALTNNRTHARTYHRHQAASHPALHKHSPAVPPLTPYTPPHAAPPPHMHTLHMPDDSTLRVRSTPPTHLPHSKLLGCPLMPPPSTPCCHLVPPGASGRRT